jgi:hypothetical protein
VTLSSYDDFHSTKSEAEYDSEWYSNLEKGMKIDLDVADDVDFDGDFDRK